MKISKIPVFNSNIVDPSELNYYINQFNSKNKYINISQLNNLKLNKNGKLKGNINPLNTHINLKDKFELSDIEKQCLQIFRHNVKQINHLLDSAERKLNLYEKYLIKESGYENYSLITNNRCEFSPIGKCVCIKEELTNKYKCIYCNDIINEEE